MKEINFIFKELYSTNVILKRGEGEKNQEMKVYIKNFFFFQRKETRLKAEINLVK